MKLPASKIVAVVFMAALLGVAGTGAFVAIVNGPAPDQKGQAPVQSFKDRADCPEMVVIPAGSFRMGGHLERHRRGRFSRGPHEALVSQAREETAAETGNRRRGSGAGRTVDPLHSRP